jgi:O-antigen/teichoic acid export membrane protein
LSFTKSRDTVITNIVQQSIAIIIFFIVPNFMTVDNFAEITFVNVLLSFMMVSDLGIASVYGRKMPAIYHRGFKDEIELWNLSVFWFRFVTSLLFSVTISLLFFIRSHNAVNSLLLFFVAPLTTLSSIYIAKYGVQSDFAIYRKVNSFQAYARLMTVPLVYSFGLFGWFLSQPLSAFATLFRIRERIFPTRFFIDFKILKQHLHEGLMLITVAFLWTQLLSSGRLFASFYYPSGVIAQYGLVNSGYQIISSLIIAAFLPITIHVLKIIYTEEEKAVQYVFRIIYQSIPVVFILAVISSEISPRLLAFFFPKYTIDIVILKTLIFSLITYPLVVTMGNFFIAKQKTAQYIVITALALGLDWFLVIYLKPYFGYRSAAIAQLISICFYTFIELLFVFYLFREIIQDKARKFAVIYGMIFVFSMFYFIVKRYLI